MYVGYLERAQVKTFSAVDTRLQNDGLSWEQCINICTDGAEAMAGNNKRFLTRVYKLRPISILRIALFIEKISLAKH